MSDVQWSFAGGGTWNVLSPEDATALEAAMKKARAEAKDALPVRLGPHKTEYVVDFIKMEQRNPVTGKIRALKREGERAKAEPAQTAVQSARPWRVGEAVECFSTSQAKWCKGDVVAVKKDCVTVEYIANQSKTMKHLPPDHEHLRRPIPAAMPATDLAAPVAKAVPISAYPKPVPPTATLTGVPGRGFPQEAPQPTLDEVPFLGERQLADVQDETVLRLRRLVRHGDLRGSQRTLLRAKLLNVELGDDLLAQIKSLEAEGEFALLLPS